MNVYEAVARSLVAEDVEVVFSLLDETTLHLVQTLSDHGIRVVRPRHEQGGVTMADGYARATGKPGVCTVGAGPGIAQTGTSLVTARRKGSPVLAIAGQVPSKSLVGDVKSFDQRAYAESTAGSFMALRSPATAATDLQLAFRSVRVERAPLVFSCPLDVLQADYPDEWDYTPSLELLPQSTRIEPDPAAIERAAEMLSGAERPILMAGLGAVRSGAKAEMEALAARTGALLSTSVQGRGYFDGHPSNIGLVGAFTSDAAIEMFADADCVLAVGIALNQYQMMSGTLLPKAEIIQIDDDPTRLSASTRVDLGVVGDARTTVKAIDRMLESANGARRTSAWASEDSRSKIASAQATPPAADPTSAERTPLSAVLAELEGQLPEDRVVIVDSGLFLPFAMDAISVPGPESWVWSLDFGSIGLGLAMAIGTSLARPDRSCVLITGDGGLMMSLPELETAARENVSLTVVVCNDMAYAPEVLYLKMQNKPPDLGYFEDVDFAAVARGLGGRGVTVAGVDDLPTATAEIGKGGLLVIDCKVSEEEEHRSFRRVSHTGV